MPTGPRRAIALGVTCVQYFDQQIIWVEVLGRPEDREKLEKYESQRAGTDPANNPIDTKPWVQRF